MSIMYTEDGEDKYRFFTNEQMFEKEIENADPKDKYKFIIGKAFNYRLAKLKMKLSNRARSKVIWAFIPLNYSDKEYLNYLYDDDIYVYILRAKGILKTHVESYTIPVNRIREIRILKSSLLSASQTFALDHYFTLHRAYTLRHNLYNFSNLDKVNDILEVDAFHIKDYLKKEKSDYIKQEVIQWLSPMNKKDEKKTENSK